MNSSGRPHQPRVERRNARFQQWQSLLTNRTKRTRSRQLLVQGVRPITLAVDAGHEVVELLVDGSRERSAWAREIMDTTSAPVIRVAAELLAELGERDSGPPEMIAIVAMPADDLSILPREPAGPIIVFDRPASPGNVGSLARSVDALGGAGLVVTGHSADPWDPASIRASTGSVFAIPIIRLASHQPLLDWVADNRRLGIELTVFGTDESATLEPADAELAGPSVIVIGSEFSGLSAGWLAACDEILAIPMGGAASSLNAASAGSILLYEALRQRRGAPRADG